MIPNTLFFSCSTSSQENFNRTILAKSLDNRLFRILWVDTGETGCECMYDREKANEVSLTFRGNIQSIIDRREHDFILKMEFCDSLDIITLRLPVCAVILKN